MLLNHFRRYPKSRAEDLVKLLYQGEFAGGHLIGDSAQSEKRMAEERRAAKAAGAPSPVRGFEDIGGGLCRMYLGALSALGISTATANRFFVNTASTVCGDTACFESKLAVLLDCCREGLLPFDAAKAAAYIASLKQAGYPPESHSAVYRAAYAPAYRVVSAQYRDFIEVFSCIDALKAGNRPAVIAIDGESAAGKTTLAALIALVYDANVIHMDDFFLPPERKTPQRLAQPGGNVDYERFMAEAGAGLKSGRAFEFRAYSCKTATFSNVWVSQNPLCIVEGAYSLHPQLINLYDLKIFLRIDKDEQSRRIMERNGAAMYRRFKQEWIPLEEAYFDALNIERQCDLVYRLPLTPAE